MSTRKTEQLEVSDIFRRLTAKVSSLSAEQRKVFEAIVNCRTAVLGGHKDRCKSCGYQEHSYNSCLNRHCPKCRGGRVFDWVAEREQELINAPYFHIVFTLPAELRTLCLLNRKLFYNLLFKASSETLLTVAKNNLGLRLGFFGVLHTWNQDLQYHPHVHYLAPAGGLSSSDGSWEPSPDGERFFLPVRILSKVYRGKFIAALKAAYPKLFFGETLSHLQNRSDFEHLLSKACKHDWVVYAKRPFSSPERVVRYLANYTHKVGISNKRLLAISDTSVSFSARDNKNWKIKRRVTLSLNAFLARFMLHVLPKGYRKVRFFGFLSQNQKARALQTIRQAQAAASAKAAADSAATDTQAPIQLPSQQKSKHPRTCPHCGEGLLTPYMLYKPHKNLAPAVHSVPFQPQISSLCLALSG